MFAVLKKDYKKYNSIGLYLSTFNRYINYNNWKTEPSLLENSSLFSTNNRQKTKEKLFLANNKVILQDNNGKNPSFLFFFGFGIGVITGYYFSK
jgi:hypothetical protein